MEHSWARAEPSESTLLGPIRPDEVIEDPKALISSPETWSRATQHLSDNLQSVSVCVNEITDGLKCSYRIVIKEKMRSRGYLYYLDL